MGRLLKANLGLGREDCQHAVIEEFLCKVTGYALGTDVCHWMFLKKSTWFKVNKIPLLRSTDALAIDIFNQVHFGQTTDLWFNTTVGYEPITSGSRNYTHP